MACDQNGGPDEIGVVQDEVPVVAPFGEEAGAEARPLHPLETVRGDDLVGVDVCAVERYRPSGDDHDGLHQCRSSGVANVPATAVAAATAGETRCVRPPRPWRPSKLRFEVDAHRSPTASLSGFMARHMEQPGSRHSKPAAVKTLSSPSASACAFTG